VEAVAPRASLGVDVVLRSRAPLVGRRELDVLDAALPARALAAARHARQRAGIGKSRLVQALLSRRRGLS
jgi:hypothetical protein